MSHAAQTWAVQQRTGSPARKAVLMNLADRADEAWSCFPGQKRIADDTELGERTVRRALDDLETAGLILRFHRRRKDGSWTSDRYVLAGYLTDPDAVRLLADSDTSGHSGRRPDRPPVTAAAHPAATAAGHEPSGSNHHSTTPPPSEGAPAADGAPQLALVDAPAQPTRPRRERHKLPEDWAASPELLAKAREKAPGVNVEAEVEKFIGYHRSTGDRKIDWDLAFLTTWMGRVTERRPGARPGRTPHRNTGSTAESTQAKWADWGRTGGDR